MKKVSLSDCIHLGKPLPPPSQRMVIVKPTPKDIKDINFRMVVEKGYITMLTDGTYTCKEIVANNLSLTIIK